MAVRIRMKKMGRTHRPFFRICAMDSRSPRDGRVIEELGFYDPMVKETDARAVLRSERIDYWLGVGAKPSDKRSRADQEVRIEWNASRKTKRGVGTTRNQTASSASGSDCDAEEGRACCRGSRRRRSGSRHGRRSGRKDRDTSSRSTCRRSAESRSCGQRGSLQKKRKKRRAPSSSKYAMRFRCGDFVSGDVSGVLEPKLAQQSDPRWIGRRYLTRPPRLGARKTQVGG